jgi:O-methyltransferase
MSTPGDKSKDLYLNLLKSTLAFSLWPEPPQPLEANNYARPAFKKFLVSAIAKALRAKRMGLFINRPISDEERAQGKVWPGYAHSMIGLKRMDNIQNCVETLIAENIPGDLIETGVWRGGACILMKAVLAANGISDRKVYVADSFQGLPKPDESKYPADTGDDHHILDFLAVSQEEVAENFRRYDLLDDNIVFVKGWFKDTLPALDTQFALIRLDGDMYSSTIEALDALYPKLALGGFCIIDDYINKGCCQAVTDYRAKHGIAANIETIDHSGVYWRNSF